jgi:uncharacterized circularly permuted ATP-grasp superfamily protein
MFDNEEVREPYRKIIEWIRSMPSDLVAVKHSEAEKLFRRIGITFVTYGDKIDAERLIPFDMVPRILTAREWRKIEGGVKQRARALNSFLMDIYDAGEIVRAGKIPAELVYRNHAYEHQAVGFKPPQGIFGHIVGTDIVRTGTDEFFVLEDNCRTPSGVSYMLENREIMMRMFPDLFQANRVAPIEDYPEILRRTLSSVAPTKCDHEPVIAVLTPGTLNSAYYEHSFLADMMGVELVEGQDLFVDGDFVYMRTIQGPQRVDILYRRVDDEFLDPLCFRSDSLLGIPGLMNAYRVGGVTICSAPGVGVADDKAIYTYVPEMIRFYLGQEPILNNVPTWRCSEPEDLAYVLDRLEELVIKRVHGSGGYGMLVGPTSTKKQIEDFEKQLRSEPYDFIAQPTLALSTSPTYVEKQLVPRHVDLRPFCLMGKTTYVCPGGLTRVALKEGSLVVNSSQGGGVKDTWVLVE